MSVGPSGVLGGLSKGFANKTRRHQNLPDVEVQHRFSRSDQLLISAARDGDTSLVLELLGCTHTVNINARDRKSGSTALCIASAWGHGKIVCLLLDHGADPTLHNFEGRSALEVAATTEITLLLLNCLPKTSSPSLLLQRTCWQSNVQLVEQLLSNRDNIDLEACNNEGLNPLLLTARDIKVFHALFQQNLLNSFDPSEVSKHLLNSGANIFHKDGQGRTALHFSVTYVSEVALKLTKLLLKFNADTNAVDKHSFSPLHFAVKSKSFEAAEILLKSGANVNQKTYAGHTPLHIAASHGDVKLAALLLNHGAGVTSVTHSGLSPLKCAANREMYSLLKAAIGAAVIESSQQLSDCQHNLRGSDRSFHDELEDGKDDGKGCRKSRNARRHKSTASVKKQLLFTMHLGLAVSKSPNGNEISRNLAQPKELSSAKSGMPGLPPSRIPVNVAKFGSGEIKGSRPISPLRSRSCTNCDGLSLPVDEFDESKEIDIHSDSSEEAKVSSVPDVLKSTSNLPLCGKNLRRHRRYVNSNGSTPPGHVAKESSHYGSREVHTRLPHHSPNRKNSGSIQCQEDSHLMADGKKVQNLFLILGNQAQKSENNSTIADYQKIKKYPDYIPSENDGKPAVHFLIDSKAGNNSGGHHRQRHKHPYSVSVKAYGKRVRNKPTKSDSEVETKSISPIKGQSINLFTSNKSSSKIVSRLPKKCKEPNHPKDAENDLLKGALLGHRISKPSMCKVVDQFRAISLQVTPSESNSTLDASISSDCVSQVSAASWIYVPNEDSPPKYGRMHPVPSTLPGLSSSGSSHSINDLRGSAYWKDSDDLATPTICEDDILIEDESPEHLYDCPITPPPSLKNPEACCPLDLECDMFQWSSTGSTPVGTIVPTVDHSCSSESSRLKLFEGKTSEECLAVLQGESESQLSISWAKGKLLGKGAFGLVWCGMTSQGDLIAVKQIKLNSTNAPEAAEEYLQIQREFQMLRKLQHRNIVSYLGTKLDGTIVSIFMQYLSGGSITNNLNQFGAFAESVICRYSKQILDGIDYLHCNGIVHRDIKGANIMVMPSETGGLIKLIDFGCAKKLHMNSQDSNHYIQSVRGTPYWMAPEVIQQSSSCTEKSDIWSVGCTVIEMATTKPPWHELPPFSAAYAIGEGTSKPKIPTNLSPIARDFIGSAMRRNPEARPHASDLLKHAFLEETLSSASLKQTD